MRTAVGFEPDRALCAQTVSSWRPLSRRAFRMARPARVRIRARKPCVLALFLLLGWYVRFTKPLLKLFGCASRYPLGVAGAQLGTILSDQPTPLARSRE